MKTIKTKSVFTKEEFDMVDKAQIHFGLKLQLLDVLDKHKAIRYEQSSNKKGDEICVTATLKVIR